MESHGSALPWHLDGLSSLMALPPFFPVALWEQSPEWALQRGGHCSQTWKSLKGDE